VPACRSLCEEVKADCFVAAGREWPIQLNCSRFPDNNDLCMQHPSSEDDEANSEIKTPFKMQTGSKCPPNYILLDSKCVSTCQVTKHDDQIIFEIGVAVGSILTLFLVLFAVLTFIIQPNRFRWPARPILFLIICGSASPIIYFIRFILDSQSCSGSSTNFSSDNWICFLTALSMIFFDFAYIFWWFAFSYVWYLSASKEWSTEAIEKISARIHSIIWSLSLTPVVHTLVSNNIQVNVFTSFCQVDSITLDALQIIIVLLGLILSIFTSKSLRKVTKMLTLAGRSPVKLYRLIYRLTSISFGISLPLLLHILCDFYYDNNNMIEFIKISSKFLSVILCTFWVFSYKTFKSWNKLLKPSFNFTTKTLLRHSPVSKV